MTTNAAGLYSSRPYEAIRGAYSNRLSSSEQAASERSATLAGLLKLCNGNSTWDQLTADTSPPTKASQLPARPGSVQCLQPAGGLPPFIGSGPGK